MKTNIIVPRNQQLISDIAVNYKVLQVIKTHPWQDLYEKPILLAPSFIMRSTPYIEFDRENWIKELKQQYGQNIVFKMQKHFKHLNIFVEDFNFMCLIYKTLDYDFNHNSLKRYYKCKWQPSVDLLLESTSSLLSSVNQY